MDEELEGHLTGLGMGKNEAKVYLTLLRRGPMAASGLAGATGLYRPFVYDILARLMEQGLASQVLIEGRKLFRASEATALREIYRERLANLDKVVEALSRRSISEDEPASVEVYKGKYAVKKAFKDILDHLIRTRVTHLGMGIDERYFINEDPYMGKRFIEGLEKHGLKEKMITFEGATEFAGGRTTQYRAMPAEFFNPTFILIDGELVTIVLWTQPRYVIKIRSKEFSDAYRKQFELTWRHCKRIKWKNTTAWASSTS